MNARQRGALLPRQLIGSYPESDRWRVPVPESLWQRVAVRTVGIAGPARHRPAARRPVALLLLGMVLGAGIAVPVTARLTAPSATMEQRELNARLRALEAEKAARQAAGRLLLRAPAAPQAPEGPRAGTSGARQ